MANDFDTLTNMLSRAGAHWELLIAKDGTVHVEIEAHPKDYASIVEGTEQGFSTIYTFDADGNLKGMGIYE